MAEKKFLTREQILNATDMRTAEVDVPEWGGTVMVRAMTGLERDAFEESITGKNKVSIRAKLASMAICDPETKAFIFTAADIEALGQRNFAALNRVCDAASNLSALTPEDMEKLEKN